MLQDRWEDAAAYDRFMGRWSRPLALAFVSWLGQSPRGSWLDVGCGTGSLTSAIFELAEPNAVTACDSAPDYVRYCREHVSPLRLEVVVASADALPSVAGGFDAVVSSLVLNFLPDPDQALAEMRSVCATGGCVAACVWDYSGGMDFLRRFWDAAVTLHPSAHPLDEAARFPLCDPGALRSAFASAGLDAVAVAPLTVPTPFANSRTSGSRSSTDPARRRRSWRPSPSRSARNWRTSCARNCSDRTTAQSCSMPALGPPEACVVPSSAP